ncbi:DUF1828 domain-containing protein [Lactococcus lactis]|uniref:DUF1828 domain-containing protein n=1 Tax=Lactococcus lactis subsp. lactis TaxID=1360 RepID=A0A2N5WAL5_LACLL|nr:DUF1828 domain-containing protein [Lactococcus lactis]MBU5242849.1 DUF1828 domain-containing protein [Lactococcus lactis]MDT2856679.1 DUF1828 domain-containing protein [Lactococcus lactis]PLW59286.1 hypothetical protein CYU10_000136 [Lactococcus lactis subsp. lactis]
MKSDKLLDDYLKWYKNNTILSNIGEVAVLSTPHTNYIGDRINLYVENLADNSIRISDDGETLNELEMASLDITSETRRVLLNNLLKFNGISLSNEGVLYLEVPRSKFAPAKHKLLEVILQTYDLLFTKRTTVKSLFLEEGLTYLKKHDFGGAAIVRKSGASGIDYGIDYILGGTSKRNETLMKFVNHFTFDDFAKQDFIQRDISKTYIDDINYVVVVNDIENKISSKVKQAAEVSNVKVIEWSDKDHLMAYK